METKSHSTSGRAPPPPFGFIRSLSPTRHFHSPPPSSSAVNFAVHNPLSPTRANRSVSSSVSLALGRSVSPNTKLQVRSAGSPPKGSVQVKAISSASSPAKMRKTCMCSPTTHPGSFRCSLHRKISSSSSSSSSAQSQLNARRSAMANSLVRIGSVEGEWVKRALTALIRPSSHHMRRRTSFQPRPSRLRHMSRAEDFS